MERRNKIEELIEKMSHGGIKPLIGSKIKIRKLMAAGGIAVAAVLVWILVRGGILVHFFGPSMGLGPDHHLTKLYGVTDYEAASKASVEDAKVWEKEANQLFHPQKGVLNTQISGDAREKWTKLAGNGNDTVTIMIYMCGSDLEVRTGAATRDLQEMIGAVISDKVNVIVETGGSEKWQNNVVSSSVNQIYQVTSDGLICLQESWGTKAMTDPEHLSEFIRYTKKNFEADRYQLILWDQGGGSVSGFGYDMKFANAGSMTLDKLNTALKNGGCKFDFVGFDACLMANWETALTLEPYADYLIASEGSESENGWYYTEWLTELSRNTSLPTIELGKCIIDTFIETSNQNGTALSLIDLSELKGGISDSFDAFSKSMISLLESQQYQVVSNARERTREFSGVGKMDQVDLIHLAENMGTNEGTAFAKALSKSIKYNLTGRGMENSFGMSIYFPYHSPSNLSEMLNINKKIGMNGDYTECLKRFANMETGGQILAGGKLSEKNLLFESLLEEEESGKQQESWGSISDRLEHFLEYSDFSGLSGFTLDTDTEWIDVEVLRDFVSYFKKNHFKTENLDFKNKEGKKVLRLKEEQWDLIQEIKLNVFLDDGDGYIDLGLDNNIRIDKDGDLAADYDRTWIAINDQVVSYHMLSQETDGDMYTIVGRVPVMLNGQLADLILEFTNENKNGSVLGVRMNDGDVTKTQTKGLIDIKDGDELQFVCNYYSKEKEFVENFVFGDSLEAEGELTVSRVSVGNMIYKACYRLTDIYNNHYWTEALSDDSR